MEVFFSMVLLFLSSFFGLESQPATPVQVEQATSTAVVTRVIDGDTIVVSQFGASYTVRYIGMDTPEPYRDGEPACYSVAATNRNKELVADKTVTLVADVEDTDKYDRLLRYVYAENILVNEVLVSEGYAKKLAIAPNVRMKELFSQAERKAKNERIGLWDACEP